MIVWYQNTYLSHWLTQLRINVRSSISIPPSKRSWSGTHFSCFGLSSFRRVSIIRPLRYGLRGYPLPNHHSRFIDPYLPGKSTRSLMIQWAQRSVSSPIPFHQTIRERRFPFSFEHTIAAILLQQNYEGYEHCLYHQVPSICRAGLDHYGEVGLRLGQSPEVLQRIHFAGPNHYFCASHFNQGYAMSTWSRWQVREVRTN